ncbi:MAG TPA: ABC transporter substrate-binding protein [Anaerolineae bacterium]
MAESSTHIHKSAANTGLASLIGLMMLVALTACGVPRQTVKIALVAPFEGYYREVGYDAFPAMRLALRDQIRAGGVGNVEVTFVAYNDNADPVFAEHVASNVAIDGDVLAVIGNYRMDTTLAALHVYTASQLPVIVPEIPADTVPFDRLVFRMGVTTSSQVDALSQCPDKQAPVNATWLQPYKGKVNNADLVHLADFQSPAAAKVLSSSIDGLCFAAMSPYPNNLPAAVQALSSFADVSGAAGAGPRSISAYDATTLLLQAIGEDIKQHGHPSRDGVAEALRHIQYHGLLGDISFDERNRWQAAPTWVYQYGPDGVARRISDTR